MENLKTMLDYALYYQSLGLSVIPAGRNKRPLLNSWKKFQEECPSKEQIIEWWRTWPDANPGCITGKVSGIVVLDLDKKHNRTSKEFKIPPTISAKSGNGGEHFFFRHPGIEVKSTSAIDGEGVDSRGDGGFIVLAPSINDKGGTYEWLIPFESRDDLAEMPQWFFEKVVEAKSDKKWLSGAEGVSEGSRNDTAASMAGKILASTVPALWESIGWKQLQVWNSQNKPPLTDKELRETWESIRGLHSKDYQSKSRIKKIGKAVTRRFSDIEAKPIEWLWPQRIPKGKLTMIAGDPGLGKSFITTSIAAIVSTGGLWPLNEYNAWSGDVIFISAEDDASDTIKPRLLSAGADCSRIHIVDAVQEKDPEGNPIDRMFSFQSDIEVLENLLKELPKCSLIIIDPISAYLDKIDSNNNSQVRGVLAPLSKLAEKYNVAIVLVSHLNKNSSEGAIYRTIGSLAFTAAMRIVYLVTKDKEDPDRRFFLTVKSNVAKDQGGLAYKIEETEQQKPVLVWESEPVVITADEAMTTPHKERDLTATDEAESFLLEILANGSVRAEEVSKQAALVGITNKPLRSARMRLGIKPKKSGFKDGEWWWALPEDALRTEDDPAKEEGDFDNPGHLQ